MVVLLLTRLLLPLCSNIINNKQHITTNAMPPNQANILPLLERLPSALEDGKIRVAILGCGMMGQEHISYISGYPSLRIDYLCDPHTPSLEASWKVMKTFHREDEQLVQPTLLSSEEDLLAQAHSIDLLVICSPNHLHTPTLQRWGHHDITIICEKPVAVSQEQHDQLQALQQEPAFVARIWVAMEYRYIPAIAKLLDLLETIGDVRMVTIRENRYPFLHKIGAWNRDIAKTGDSLVEKCCHFFDLFRLITGKEVQLDKVRALAQRGFNYEDEEPMYDIPIMDSAYVTMPFESESAPLIGCLELCMFAEGSRHQEEIIVTGSKV
jgi:myo-inositol 2-dehydrogenase / D-chiro-inositol 1-dehydrogenase